VTRTDEPYPKPTPGTPRSFTWPTAKRLACPPVTAPEPADFSLTLEARRSVRSVARCSFHELINLLAYTTKPRFLRDGDQANTSLRLSPSAGALHCISTLIIERRGTRRAFRYDSANHLLEVLVIAEQKHLDEFLALSEEILPNAHGAVVVLIADVQRIKAKYANPDSLLWRDAGVLLQTLSLCSVAYGLVTCLIGGTGAEVVRALGLPSSDFKAVGGIVVGHHQPSPWFPQREKVSAIASDPTSTRPIATLHFGLR